MKCPHLIQNKLLPIREAEQLMFFREIIADCDNRTKRNTLPEYSAEFNIDYRIQIQQHDIYYILIILCCNMFGLP